MILKYDMVSIAEVIPPPESVEFSTLFGVPIFVLEGEELSIELLSEHAEIEQGEIGEQGVANAGIPSEEDRPNVVIWIEGKPEHREPSES